jgi:hypothetical protein
MTNVISPAAAVASGIPTMANVIDSLKRLERIGSEESETVRKILEAASELSNAICRSFPQSLLDCNINGLVLSDGTCVLNSGDNLRRDADPKYFLGPYSVTDYYLGPRLLKSGTFVGESRDVALAFARDLSLGLLEIFALFIEKEHETSKSGLTSILSAADLLKAQKK